MPVSLQVISFTPETLTPLVDALLAKMRSFACVTGPLTPLRLKRR
jgi:hypothetical protein